MDAENNRRSRSSITGPCSPQTNGNGGREIAAIISRLLSHYWTADDPTESRREQVIDWIDDLIEFGPNVVADACREWRRTQHRRPVPSDIRRMCVEAQTASRERRALAAPTDMDEYARDVGFSSHAERMQAIRRDNERAAYLRSPANGERLRKIADQIAGMGGKPKMRKAAQALHQSEIMRLARVALGLEAKEAAE